KRSAHSLRAEAETSDAAETRSPVKAGLFACELQHRHQHSAHGYAKKQYVPPHRHRMLPQQPPVTKRVAVPLGATLRIERKKQPRMVNSQRLLVADVETVLDHAKHKVVVLATGPRRASTTRE